MVCPIRKIGHFAHFVSCSFAARIYMLKAQRRLAENGSDQNRKISGGASQGKRTDSEQLDMAVLYERYLYDREILDAILDMMLDVLCFKRKTIRIAGDDKPVNVVKSQLLKLILRRLRTNCKNCIHRNMWQIMWKIYMLCRQG